MTRRDSDGKAHYVREPRELRVAIAEGRPVTTACGKRVTPWLNANEVPVCTSCVTAALLDAFADPRWTA